MIDYTLFREDITDKYIQLGQTVFNADFKRQCVLEKHAITQWLFVTAQEDKVLMSSREISHIVDKVFAHANDVCYFHAHTLNAGMLKARLESIPDNTPIAYQRIEDVYFTQHNWEEKQLVGDRKKASSELIQWARDNPSTEYRLTEENNQVYLEFLNGYIPAFDAYVHADDEGKKIFVINAHY